MPLISDHHWFKKHQSVWISSDSLVFCLIVWNFSGTWHGSTCPCSYGRWLAAARVCDWWRWQAAVVGPWAGHGDADILSEGLASPPGARWSGNHLWVSHLLCNGDTTSTVVQRCCVLDLKSIDITSIESYPINRFIIFFGCRWVGWFMVCFLLFLLLFFQIQGPLANMMLSGECFTCPGEQPASSPS